MTTFTLYECQDWGDSTTPTQETVAAAAHVLSTFKRSPIASWRKVALCKPLRLMTESWSTLTRTSVRANGMSMRKNISVSPASMKAMQKEQTIKVAMPIAIMIAEDVKSLLMLIARAQSPNMQDTM